MHKDSYLNTVIVAVGVCLVCSLLVSSAAVGLRDLQKKNVELDRKKNILNVAGFDATAITDKGGVEKLFSQLVEADIVNLETGKPDMEGFLEESGGKFPNAERALAEYDPVKTAKDSKSDAIRSKLGSSEDIAGIGGYREKYSMVYRIKDDQGNLVKYVFPIRGSGLWSILKGFISLEKDLQTIAGITYYEHAETPGLGGEVDNPSWKKKWSDKKVYGEDGEVRINVAKGLGSGDYQVDGLSGATITSRGVSNMLEFWLGDSGFEKYVEAQKQSGAAGSSVEQGDK